MRKLGPLGRAWKFMQPLSILMLLAGAVRDGNGGGGGETAVSK
jgi:hypothetical protein